MLTRWYVLLTEPNRESAAVSGLVGRHIEAYGPTVHRKVVKRGRKFDEARPMFPGYIFARLTPRTDDFHVPRRVAGIRDYLRLSLDGRSTPEPYPLPNGLVELIGAREAAEFEKFQARKGIHKFDVGQAVQVDAGPFASFVGQVSALDERGRVQALLDIFGRKTPVWFDSLQLEAV